MMNFRTLKEGDYVSAKEWNALVAFIKSMSRSAMTDGIMDSAGFHPRKKLTKPAEVNPVITFLGPATYTNYPGATANTIAWLNARTSYKDCFEVEAGNTNIILKKRGWYEFDCIFQYGKVGTGVVGYVLHRVEWYKDEAWHGWFTGHPTLSYLYGDFTAQVFRGSAGLFFDKDSKIRIGSVIHINSGSATFDAVGPCFRMNLKYCGDVIPEGPDHYTNTWE